MTIGPSNHPSGNELKVLKLWEHLDCYLVEKHREICFMLGNSTTSSRMQFKVVVTETTLKCFFIPVNNILIVQIYDFFSK